MKNKNLRNKSKDICSESEGCCHFRNMASGFYMLYVRRTHTRHLLMHEITNGVHFFPFFLSFFFLNILDYRCYIIYTRSYMLCVRTNTTHTHEPPPLRGNRGEAYYNIFLYIFSKNIHVECRANIMVACMNE